MKRLLVVCAASLLPCFLVSAQEADNSGRSVELSVIPRLDLNPVFFSQEGGSSAWGTEFTLGNTSLYSLFEGNITENLSFSVCNHWAAFDSVHDVFESTKQLYQSTFYSDNTNWLDWAYLTFDVGSFAFTVGKDMVTTGGLEFDDYDFEVHPSLVSSFWQNFACYQWGAKAAFTTPSESDTFSFQFSTSPYGERPFASGLFNYSLEWRGEHGPLETIWSATAMGVDKGEFQPVFALGQRLNFDSWAFGLDAFSVVGDPLEIVNKGITLMPSVSFSPNEKITVLAKGGYENYSLDTVLDDYPVKRWWGGLAFHWFPIENLRVHAVASYDHTWQYVSLTAGLLYNISLF